MIEDDDFVDRVWIDEDSTIVWTYSNWPWDSRTAEGWDDCLEDGIFLEIDNHGPLGNWLILK